MPTQKQLQLTCNLTPSGCPWVIAGYTAQLMGDAADGNAFIKNIETQFVYTNFTGCVNGRCKP